MKRKKKINHFNIKRGFFKLILLSIFYLLPLVDSTNAVYLDRESSNNNLFSAGSLDFSLRDDVDVILISPFFNVYSLRPNNQETKTLKVKKDGSLDFKYDIKVNKTSGDEAFCQALNLEAKLNGITKYNGGLLSLAISPVTINGSGQDDWEFILSFTNNAVSLENKDCGFNFVFKGWQINSDGSWGMTDEEILVNTVNSGDWTAPVISNVTHLIATPEEINDMIAIITWNTDELSTSNLRWSDNAGATWHEINDDFLADNTSHRRQFDVSDTTTYQYQAISNDQAGNTTTSLIYPFTTGDSDLVADVVPTTDIVINEFLPNPLGVDNALYPGGEWVEIYNRGATTYDMSGWSIGAYNTSSYRLYLNFGINTFSSDGNNDKWFSPGEFMVIYRNGDGTFYLKNGADDRIRLFNASNVRVDRYMYTTSQVIENKSIARYPDGSDTWFDPIPSPGKPNILESTQCVVTPTPTPTPSVELTVAADKKTVSFKVKNIKEFKKLSYELTYETAIKTEGILGEKELDNQDEFVKGNVILGTCSSGGTCVYHNGIKEIRLKVILVNQKNGEEILEKTLNYD